MAKLLEVVDLKTHISVHSGVVHAVDGLSFDVEKGETVGIVGESGCGKTMAAMSIMRLLPHRGYIAGGEIVFDGRDLVALSDDQIRRVRGNEIGMIFQDPMTSLNPTMTIGRQIGEAVRIHRHASKAEALERAREVLELVGVPNPKERVYQYPHQLSGGLRQRVMIAMALACDPALLIADEPTTALDVTIQDQILKLLDRLKEELEMGIILITHDMGVIAGRADRVVVMYAGEKIETATTGELFSNVRHPYTEALLASIPKLKPGQVPGAVLDPGTAARPARAADGVPVRGPLRVRHRGVSHRQTAAHRRRSRPPVRVLSSAPLLRDRGPDARRRAHRPGGEQRGAAGDVRA